MIDIRLPWSSDFVGSVFGILGTALLSFGFPTLYVFLAYFVSNSAWMYYCVKTHATVNLFIMNFIYMFFTIHGLLALFHFVPI